MKNFFCFLLMFIIATFLYPQKVKVRVDEFTDKKIIETSWETLAMNMSGEWYYRFYSQGKFYYDLKISAKNAKKLQASYKLFKDELNKK